MRFSIMLICLLMTPALAVPSEKNFFPIGIWYEGGVGDARNNLIPEDAWQAAAYYQRTMGDIARHGLNLVVVPNTPPTHHLPLLDAVQKAGLRAIIELGFEGGAIGHLVRSPQALTAEPAQAATREWIKPIRRHPALYGIQILDEPPPSAFPNYQIAQTTIEELSSKRAFCCLIGGGGVAEFCQQVKPRQVAFDCYPIGEQTPEGDRAPLDAYLAQCQRAAEGCRPFGVPFWAVIQAHSITGIHRHPTPTELRLMTYLALSEGARGIFYFLYQTELFSNNPPQLMEGVVTSEYHETVQFRAIRRLAGELKRLAPILMSLERTAQPGLLGETTGVHCSAWKDPRGSRYVIGVNLNTRQPAHISLALPAAPGKGRWLLKDVLTGQTASRGAHLENSLRFFLTLPPGGTCMLKLIQPGR